MPHAMYVRLTAEEADALRRLAQRERRTMRDQAALVLAQELRRRGLLGRVVRPVPLSLRTNLGEPCKGEGCNGPSIA